MKAKDIVCTLALLVVATGAARVVLAAGAPCTGWAGACHITPSPAAGSGTCCKAGGYGSNDQEYLTTGTGGKLYIQATAGQQCGDTATAYQMGESWICGYVSSTATCGGNLAIPMCTGTP